jgi:hypothetical protein
MMYRPFLVVSVGCLLLGFAEAPQRPDPPFRVAAVETVTLVESGAIVAEDFAGPRLDLTRWRVWQQNPDQTTVRQERGQLALTGRGSVGHNGLFGLTTAKYKDVVLVGEMDIRSQGPAPHRLALHLCGGDGNRSPDHWVEIDMVDLGDMARFSPMAALPIGLDRQQGKFLDLPHSAGRGFLCRLSLNGDTNLVELSVKTDAGWRAICPPVALPLRTIHTEVKLHGSEAAPPGAATVVTESQAWFDNVRIYPRPECHHVGIRLVRANGREIWFRENDGWPPKIVDAAGKTRSIEDLEVQLWTADGKTQVAAVRSANMGFYLLPLKDAPWDVYPVAAEVRVVLDGQPLGPPLRIECQGVQGLYPDDVYNVVLAEEGRAARVGTHEKPPGERITGRTYPSVFQAWSPAENVKERWSWQSLWGGSAERTAARHDLIFSTPEYFGLRWNDRHAGLATGFTPESIKRGREYRQRLLELNPNLILLSELRYRDGLYSPPDFWQQGEYPQDSELWLRDQDGRLCPGWGEDADGDGTVERHEIQHMLLDFRNSKLHESIAARALALKQTGLFDGIMLDWWNEHDATTGRWPDWQGSVLTRDEELAARLAILRTIRQRVGDDFLILVNANDRTVPQSAPYVNGLFMECWKPRYGEGYAPERFDQIAATLRWAEEHLKQPRINCVEGWRIVSELAGDRTTRIKERDSEANRKWMRLFTTLSLTHSDGYVLFGDDNAQPAPDHLHNWYPFWDKSLGRPVAKGRKADDGSFHRVFDQGTAVYNPPGNRAVTVSFARPHQSLATGQTAREHQIAECDGDIFVQARFLHENPE